MLRVFEIEHSGVYVIQTESDCMNYVLYWNWVLFNYCKKVTIIE